MLCSRLQPAKGGPRYRSQAGQTSIIFVIMLSLFLLAVMSFAVDYTNIWFHRQRLQTTADAACLAGVMDLYQLVSGASLPNMNFVPGVAGTCSSYSSGGPSMCWYAGKNGFNGYSGGSASVSWSFPTSVPGVTAPPASRAPNPFMQVTVSTAVKTYFSTLLTGNQTQQVGANSTCGLTEIPEGAPIMILHPTLSGALYFTGGASLTIVGGPPRSIVINSNNSTAALCGSSGAIDTTKGGPGLTGSDVGTYGGPHTAPGAATGCYGTNSNTGLPAGFNGGSTGHWVWPASPVPDPYAEVPAPAGMRNVAPLTKRTYSGYGTFYFVPLARDIDGCPDTAPTNWVSWGPAYGYPNRGCKEYAPGYYPNGISESANDVITFLPGVYYLDGDLAIGGSDTIRMAKPCANSQGVVNGTAYCSPITRTAGANGAGGGGPWVAQRTDGVMFYFHGTAKPIISGGSGAPGYPRVLKTPVTDLTCDGTTPPSYLNLPSALDTNMLLAQCTSKGWYYDQAGDTADSTGGVRGLLMFMDHADTADPQLQGSGTLAYTGTLYFHSTSYGTIFQIPGGTTNGTLIWGNIVADQMRLTGSGALKMALNPAATTPFIKVSLLQ